MRQMRNIGDVLDPEVLRKRQEKLEAQEQRARRRSKKAERK
jgi:hypothetical protein